MKTRPTALLAAALLALGTAAHAGPPARPLPPSDSACKMVAPTVPVAFGPGETLEFDLDAIGAKAGTMTLRTLSPTREGTWPLQATAQTNTFFSKVRRVKGVAISYVHPRSLKPTRYVEDATENDLHRNTEAIFIDVDHRVRGLFKQNDVPSHRDFRMGTLALDNVGAVYFMRQLPLAAGLPICFDVFAIRKLWRLTGKVVGKEHVSLPIGEFEAWHLQGTAFRLDDLSQKREIHLWISDDARRLPLVAVGSIDLGAVRATLTAFNRPMDKGPRKSARKQDVAF